MTTQLSRLCLALLLLALASCASMMAGRESSIAITSSPSGATVTTCTGLVGQTPCLLALPNGSEVTVTAEHEAHPGDVRAAMSVPDLSRWYAGNLLMIGGTAGMISDMANPAAYVHKQDIHFDFHESADELERKETLEIERLRRRRASSGGTLQ